MLRILLALSFILAVTYGIYGYDMYAGAPPYAFPAAFKASSIVILGVIALMQGPRLLTAALLFGALGDALLAWSHDAFLYGALAFLVGHLCYIALFLAHGIGVRQALGDRMRLLLLAVTVLAALAASQLTPHDSSMFVPLSVYSGVLTLMVLSSYTLPWSHRLAMLGAALFFISDGFVAWNMFHHDPDPALAFWRSFAGWMIYWAGQAGLCFGALGLRAGAAK
ncbi:MAG: lysoplasmalogenase [Terricaulis sp.]